MCPLTLCGAPDDRRRVLRKLIEAEPKTAIVDHKILSVDEAVWFHRLEQRCIPRCLAWAQVQVTKTINPVRLLCASRDRPSAGCCAAEKVMKSRRLMDFVLGPRINPYHIAAWEVAPAGNPANQDAVMICGIRDVPRIHERG
jgi:hypothetical protein